MKTQEFGISTTKNAPTTLNIQGSIRDVKKLQLIGSVSIYQKKYELDCDNLKTLQDVIDVIKAMDITVLVYDSTSKRYDNLIEKGLLKEIK